MRRIKLANAAPNVPLAVLDALTRTVMPLRSTGDLTPTLTLTLTLTLIR